MKKYEKEVFEFLDDVQLEELLKATNKEITSKNKENIKNKVHQSISEESKSVGNIVSIKKKRNWTYVLGTVAALCLMVGFTQRDAIKLAYLKNFGTESEKILLNADKLSQSVENQGLKLTAKSSFKDGDSTYVFMTLQDLTNDRLSKDTQIDRWNMLSGGNTSVIDYDEKTKTATLVTSAISMENNRDYGYELNRLKSHKLDKTYKKDIDWNQLLQKEPTWKKRSLTDGNGGGYKEEELNKLDINFDELSKIFLEPKVLNEPLDTDGNIFIENMAYKDNLLHVLVKHPNDLKSEGLFLSLYSKTNQTLIESVADFQAVTETHNNDTGRSDYQEFVFDIPKEDLKDYSLQSETFGYEDVVDGTWVIQLKEPTELERKKIGPITLQENIKLSDIYLSGISLSFNYDSKDKEDVPLEVKLIQKNGNEKNIKTNNLLLSSKNNEGEQTIKIVYDYVPLDDIDSIIINGNKIDVTK